MTTVLLMASPLVQSLDCDSYIIPHLKSVVAAKSLIKNGEVPDGILNMIEMGFRAYDPCHACATHSLPGGMPLEVAVYDTKGNLVKKLKRG